VEFTSSRPHSDLAPRLPPCGLTLCRYGSCRSSSLLSIVSWILLSPAKWTACCMPSPGVRCATTALSCFSCSRLYPVKSVSVNWRWPLTRCRSKVCAVTRPMNARLALQTLVNRDLGNHEVTHKADGVWSEGCSRPSKTSRLILQGRSDIVQCGGAKIHTYRRVCGLAGLKHALRPRKPDLGRRARLSVVRGGAIKQARRQSQPQRW